MTKKIFLLSDDYNELLALQADFKKVGLDIQSASNDSQLGDQLLTFNPDLILVMGRVSKNLPLNVGSKLKESVKTSARVILIFPRGTKLLPSELAQLRMDLFLEDPQAREKLLASMAKLLSLDAQTLIQKLNRGLNLVEDIPSSASNFQNAYTDPERMKGYTPFLNLQIDKKSTSHSRQDLKDRQSAMRKGWDLKWLGQLDELKQQFVRALFKKTGS